jgi:hypothetical protein
MLGAHLLVPAFKRSGQRSEIAVLRWKAHGNVLYHSLLVWQNPAMQFAFPWFPAEFEIPDAWLDEAGMAGFTLRSSAYRSPAADAVALDDIEPPFRLRRAPLDWRGFNRERMVSILKGFVDDAELPPIDLLILPPTNDMSADPFKYRLLEGCHRFYASIAAGFEFVPATTRGVTS